MKYKIGDLVKIKSMTWWKENRPKSFPKLMAKECCGETVEIEDIDINGNLYPYFITSGWKNWWFREEWIEKKIGVVKIKLKLMKGEI